MHSDNNEIEKIDEEEKEINDINHNNNNNNENDNNNNNNNNNNNKNEINNEIKIKEFKKNQPQIITKDLPETIVSLILDRIISNIIIEKKIKDIYSTLPEHCFNYMNKLMSFYLKNNFIFHENGIDNLSYQENLLFYNKKPINKVNNWNIVKEPSVPELDRNITGKNKLIKLSKKEEINLINKEIKKENENDNNGINDTNSMQINSKDEIEENNSIINNEKNNIGNIVKKKKYKIKKSFGEIVREKELKLKKEEFENKNKNKVKNIKINIYSKNNEEKDNEEEDDVDNFVLEMTAQHDLINVDSTYKFYNDNHENDLLRKEREKLLIEKEKERIKEEERKKKEKYKKLKFHNKKSFESNFLTFDSNGKIIKKNLTSLNNIKKDFPKPKLKIKDNSNISEEKKRISLNPIQEKSIKNKKNKSKKEIIIFNPIDKINLFDFVIPKKRNNNKEIKISGNNFELVKPEVGVVISNENSKQKKEGGFDYLKKYNKPSMNDYNNSRNSNNLLSSYMSINDNIYNDKDENENNYIGYKQEFNDNNNPLIQDGYQISSYNSTKNKYKEMNVNDNDNDNINNNININNLNILKNKKNILKIKKSIKKDFVHSYDSIKMNNNRYKSYNTIQLNENIKDNNLKSIFDENEEYKPNIKYNSIDNDSYTYLRKKELLLNRNKHYKKRRELPLITETNGNKNILDEYVDINKINKFNFRIIKDKKWGNDIYSNSLNTNKNKNKNNLIKSDNNMQTDGNINIFRKGNLSNRIKESGINIINNIRTREKNKKILLKSIEK